MGPALTLLAALALALGGSFAIEAALSPERAGSRPGDIAIRLASYALVTLFWFVFSWRPWLAGTSCLLQTAIIMGCDRAKRRVIGEPVVFSDLALLKQVPRYPNLYYARAPNDPVVVLGAAASLGAIWLWYRIEPSILPDGGVAALAAAIGLPLALALLVLAGAHSAGVQKALRTRFPRPDPEADVARYGQSATLIAYALRRFGERDAPVPQPNMLHTIPARDREVFVVVQLESFVDPERLGGPPLPLMERIRREAAQFGRLAVPAHGAYTMRSEHAVLTGIEADALGFGRFDPYLANGGREPGNLARIARTAGYGTLFVHPFFKDFFDRERIVAELGFARQIMGEDFSQAPHVGPYVADAALAERMIAEIVARPGPLFLFCVTMENHGPWKPGRLPGLDDPLAQYLQHVRNTGAAVEALIDALSAEPHATLCVYGDHPPSLPSCRPTPGSAYTDCAIFRFGEEVGQPRRVDLTAAALGRTLAGLLGGAGWPPRS